MIGSAYKYVLKEILLHSKGLSDSQSTSLAHQDGLKASLHVSKNQLRAGPRRAPDGHQKGPGPTKIYNSPNFVIFATECRCPVSEIT